MLAFDVGVNGSRLGLIGAADWTQLSLIVHAGRGGLLPSTLIRCDLGGMARPDTSGVYYHLRWRGVDDLAVGSSVTLTVVDTDHPDPPTKRFRSDYEVRESPYTEEEAREMRYRDYLELKREFEE